MRQQLVYDLPTRVFHWLFSGLFLTAIIIGKTIDDESPVFSYHMLAGLTLGFLLILRIIWGIIGTKHARFTHFALNPSALIDYFKGIFKGDKRKWAGHNPASSWAALVMMLIGLGLGATGYLMATGNKEAYEDVHELLANGFIVLVVLHISGVVLHTFRHQDMIALSMVDGKKSDVALTDTITSSQPVIGLTMIALVVAFGLYLNKNYDNQAKTLALFGSTLQLGETESSDTEKAEAVEIKVPDNSH